LREAVSEKSKRLADHSKPVWFFMTRADRLEAVQFGGCTIILSKLFNIRQTLASLRGIIKVFRASDLAPDVAQQKNQGRRLA
jgi:hypothetical protein